MSDFGIFIIAAAAVWIVYLACDVFYDYVRAKYERD